MDSDLDGVIRRRRMCRDFSDRPVEPAAVDRILDRARRAPSAGHTQGWAFLVLDTPQDRSRFWAATAEADWLAAPTLPGLVRAPVVVVPLSSREAYVDRYREADKQPVDWTVPYWLVDTAFATMLLLLGTEAEGLGALFFRLRAGADRRLREEFSIPGEWEPLGALAIGWPAPGGRGPAGSAARRSRRRLEEVVHRGDW